MTRAFWKKRLELHLGFSRDKNRKILLACTNKGIRGVDAASWAVLSDLENISSFKEGEKTEQKAFLYCSVSRKPRVHPVQLELDREKFCSITLLFW